MQYTSLLSLIGDSHHEAVDALVPHSPWRVAFGDDVALNPQPLPPLTGEERVVAAAVVMTHRVCEMAVEAAIRGEDVSFVDRCVEDFRESRWPRWWPRPWPDPGPEEGPHPEPWVVDRARAASAVVLARYAARLGRSDLGRTLGRGAERLAEAVAAERT